MRRFKTGTPARIHRDSIDFSQMEIQEGDKDVEMFSFEDEIESKEQLPCYLTYTNAETHKIIRENLHRYFKKSFSYHTTFKFCTSSIVNRREWKLIT